MKRTPLARFRKIHQMILAGGATTPKMAKALEVSYNTVQRDLDFMRDQMCWPLEYDTVRSEWRFTGKIKVCPLCLYGHE